MSHSYMRRNNRSYNYIYTGNVMMATINIRLAFPTNITGKEWQEKVAEFYTDSNNSNNHPQKAHQPLFPLHSSAKTIYVFCNYKVRHAETSQVRASFVSMDNDLLNYIDKKSEGNGRRVLRLLSELH